MSATPILDLEQPLPQPSRRSRWLPRLVGLILGLVIGLIYILEDQNQLPNWNWPPFNPFLIIPALYLAIAVHEAGHVLAGNLAGLHTGGIAVGGFVFFKSGSNWSFRFDRRRWIGGFFKPLTDSATLPRSSYICMIAGGPLASALLTEACRQASVHSGGGAWNWIGTLFWIALFTLLISALPFSSGLNKSDGARLWSLLRYPDRARSWIALLAVQTQEAQGLLPREWDRQLFDQMLAVDAFSRRVSILPASGVLPATR